MQEGTVGRLGYLSARVPVNTGTMARGRSGAVTGVRVDGVTGRSKNVCVSVLESYRESVLELGVVTGMIVIFTGRASKWSYTACNDSDGNLYGESLKAVLWLSESLSIRISYRDSGISYTLDV